MKLRKIILLSAIGAAGAYVVHRYKNLEPRENMVEKKLIVLKTDNTIDADVIDDKEENNEDEEVEEKNVEKEEIIEEQPKETISEENKLLVEKMFQFKHLSRDFIDTVYSQKTNIEEDCGKAKKIKIFHQLQFEDELKTKEFMAFYEVRDFAISLMEDYVVRISSTIEFVDVVSVIDEILGVANKTNELQGSYQGYAIKSE